MTFKLTPSEFKIRLQQLCASHPVVVVPIGVPASGKSTFAQFLGMVSLSSDSFRELLSGDVNNMKVSPKVFDTMKFILYQRCYWRQATFYDATNTKVSDRKEVFKIAKAACRDTIMVAIHFKCSTDLAKERNRQRDRCVPEEVIDKFHQRIESNLSYVTHDSFDVIVTYDVESDSLVF